MKVRDSIYCFLLFLSFLGCKQKNSNSSAFTLLSSDQTGVGFVNEINDTASFNILDYLYYYNGGGVAIGDINNDGLADIFFTSNQAGNKLYLNKGNLQFEDISTKSGIEGKGNWKTGVTMADVNGDGLLDIYVSEVGGYKSLKGRNELFINKGNLTFTEEASLYGIDVEGFNTQAVFFDYDRDNDLDLFIVNHSVHSNETYGDSSLRNVTNKYAGDKLFRNDSISSGRHYTEVTVQANIISSIIGYGLNAMAADINNDGWPDIYVSNDFHENDYYYLNKGDGSFIEMNREAFGHESRFSMGSDIADINNDGWLDILTLDMLPSEEMQIKSAAGDDPLDIYNFKHDLGFHHQFSRNCLQLNVGRGRKFVDIGLYAGVAATDWSWSPLMADFDNDGVKDIFISNGILRRPNDLDFLKFLSNRNATNAGRAADVASIQQMPNGKVSNKIYKGSDSLLFADKTNDWGLNIASFSNGAATADLDNDGDLDLVVNNINQKAFIYRNNSESNSNRHFLNIQLTGNGLNDFAIGARAIIKHNGITQVDHLSSTKGFESGSLQYIHFGTGKDSVLDELVIIWPEGDSMAFTNVKTDQLLKISKATKSTEMPSGIQSSGLTGGVLFEDISSQVHLPYEHKENGFIDFNSQPLLPHQLSTRGPKIAIADIDRDGLEDMFICGARNQPGKLFKQTKQSTFVSTNENLFLQDSASEDVDAVFFDADNDGDKDLLVISGGNEFPKGATQLLDRLYINNGIGGFSKSMQFPKNATNKTCVTVADIDGDKDLDVFIGASNDEADYGVIPLSYLIKNDGNGKFSLVTNGSDDLKKPGMVMAASFFDADGDKDPDLLVAGEWMTPTVFINDKGHFTKGDKLKSESFGWWQSVLPADVDADGDMDFIAGNWGLNSKLTPTISNPLLLYNFDYDNNQTTEQILAYGREGKYYSFLGKDELEKQIPSIKKEYLQYKDFAGKTIQEIFKKQLPASTPFKATTFSSSVFINDGKGNFEMKSLPVAAQLAPVFAIVANDFNKDGILDLVAGGNFSGVLPYEGKYDAIMPVFIEGLSQNRFTANLNVQKALLIEGEIRDMKIITLANQTKCIVMARNNDKPVFLAWKNN